jgi:exosortase
MIVIGQRSIVRIPKRSGYSSGTIYPESIEEPFVSDTPVEYKNSSAIILACGGTVFAAFLWSYWPTLKQLADAWHRIPDYSHGILVAPLAAVFLWVNRKTCPGFGRRIAWAGFVFLGFAVALRYVGSHFFFGSVDAWSMLIWLSGVVWLLGGKGLFRWALPSIIFLFFMVPLPYGVERWLSLPLQRIAALVSSWALQCLGQPAIAEGNTIWVGNHTLEVEQACSGLRIFVGIFALAFAYLLFARHKWWERIILLAAAIPISLTANSLRIVATALLYQYASSDAAKRFSHDFAGWAMIPFAAALFGLTLWYVRSMVREVEEVDMRSMIETRRV